MKEQTYVNDAHRIIVEALKAAGIAVKSPIMLTANQFEKEWCVSVEYMSVGVHIPKSAIDEDEVRNIDEETAGCRFILNKVWHQKD